MSKRRMMSNAGLLTGGQVLSTAAIFLRNLVIARTLTKEGYGVATTFAIALTVVTTLGNLSVESLLVQAKDGEEERFQRTGQMLRFCQGLILAAVLFFTAPAIARMFGLPDLVGTYRMLALAPLMNAFVHFDTKRFLRGGRFGPEVLTECGSQLTSLILVCCLAPFIQDYRLLVFGLLTQFTALTVLTHLVARRRYGWALDRGYARRLLGFGWPLLLSGFCMMAASQGERLIIGASESLEEFAAWWRGAGAEPFAYTKEDLAAYAISLGLALIPTLFFAKVVPTMWFPLLSARQDDLPGFHRLYSVMAGLAAVFAASLVAVFTVAGEEIIVLMYTDRYQGVGLLIAVLVCGQAVRILRYLPITGAMAFARTRIALWAHVARALAVVLALLAAIEGVDLTWIACCSVGGEILALAVAVALFFRDPHHSVKLLFRPVLFLGTWVALAFGVAALVSDSGFWVTGAAAAATLAGVLASALGVFPILLTGVREVVEEKRARSRAG